MTSAEARTARLRLGISRAEAGRRLGVPYRTLEDWEAGINPPHPLLERALRDLAREIMGARQ